MVVVGSGNQDRTTSNGATDLSRTMILAGGSGLLHHRRCLSGSSGPVCWGLVSIVVRTAIQSTCIALARPYPWLLQPVVSTSAESGSSACVDFVCGVNEYVYMGSSVYHGGVDNSGMLS